jgi:hypothetical protein
MFRASQRRSSRRRRQRALNVTNAKLESSQKRTTGEVIIDRRFVIRFSIQ